MHPFGESERVRKHLASRAHTPRVVVLGDLMLDRYLYGDADRISPEAPVPVVRIRRETFVAGGAANVALNLSKLGAETVVVGYLGDDANAEKLRSALNAAQIQARAVCPTGYPTVTKTRVLGGHQQMIRIDMEEPEVVGPDAEGKLAEAFDAALSAGVDAVLLSDYSKGVLSDDVCRHAIAACRAQGIPCFVDPKGIDYSAYRGATCISPNRKELAAAVHAHEWDLDRLLELGMGLRERLSIDYLLATLGDQGMALIGKSGLVRYPTQAQEVFDVSGAGDTVIATLAFAVGAGFEIDLAVRLSNTAAGFVVGKLGTYAISRDELLEALDQSDSAHATSVLGPNGLAQVVAGWSGLGLKVTAFADRFDRIDFHEIAAVRCANPGAKLIAVILAENAEESRSQARSATLLSIPDIDAVAVLPINAALALLQDYGVAVVAGQVAT